MTQILEAYQAQGDKMSSSMKQPEPDAQTLENQNLHMQLSDLHSELILSETKLAQQQKLKQVDSNLRQQLQKAENELQTLKMRFQNRPQPYYEIIREHFSEDQLQKFVDPQHECRCNHCGKELTILVSEGAEKLFSERVGRQLNM